MKKCLPQDLCNRRHIFLQEPCIKEGLYTQELCITEEVPQLRAGYIRRSIDYKSFVAEEVSTTIAVPPKKYFPKEPYISDEVFSTGAVYNRSSIYH